MVSSFKKILLCVGAGALVVGVTLAGQSVDLNVTETSPSKGSPIIVNSDPVWPDSSPIVNSDPVWPDSPTNPNEDPVWPDEESYSL